VLEFRNTKLAVVEAKAWDEALTEGVAQASIRVPSTEKCSLESNLRT